MQEDIALHIMMMLDYTDYDYWQEASLWMS